VLVGGVQLRPIYISLYGRNFAGYVINTAGLEDIGCR